MIPPRDHSWDLTPAEAIHLQEEISEQVHLGWDGRRIDLIGGADVSYVRSWNRAFASILVFRIESDNHHGEVALREIERGSTSQEICYPYIPGLLVFREGPALEEVWHGLRHKPDLLLFDGAGIAHPRRCGLAAHLGWRWQIPAIGCAKSRLIGTAEEVKPEKGARTPLYEKKTRIGDVVRTRTRVKPLYVSPGHLTDFEVAVNWTLRTALKYKLPEPTRQADLLTRELKESFRRQLSSEGGQV